MTDNKERDAFEAHYTKQTFTVQRDGDGYKHPTIQKAWEAWQARAALAASQEKAEPVWRKIGYIKIGTDGCPRAQLTTSYDAAGNVWADATPLYAAPVAAQADMRECRHCGWMCAPNAAKSKRWYPLAEPVAAQASEPDYKFMFEDAVRSLAAIDAALGIDPDEAGGAEPILEAIAELKAAPQPSAVAVRDAALEEAAAVTMKAPITAGMSEDKSAQALAFHASARIRALKSAPPQPAEQTDECGMTVSDYARVEAEADQPIARRVWKIHPDSPLGKALREHSTKTYTPRTPESVNMEGRRFIYQGDGAILDDNFDFDASFSIGGDFGDPAIKDAYCKMICDVLNGISPAEQPSASSPALSCEHLRDILHAADVLDFAFESDTADKLRAIASAQGEQA